MMAGLGAATLGFYITLEATPNGTTSYKVPLPNTMGRHASPNLPTSGHLCAIEISFYLSHYSCGVSVT